MASFSGYNPLDEYAGESRAAMTSEFRHSRTNVKDEGRPSSGEDNILSDSFGAPTTGRKSMRTSTSFGEQDHFRMIEGIEPAHR